jgi:hypothetical protein
MGGASGRQRLSAFDMTRSVIFVTVMVLDLTRCTLWIIITLVCNI